MDLFSIIFFVVGVPMTIVTAIYAHATYLYARGDLAQQKGRYDHAIRRFEKAARGINPFGRGIALTALARVYLKADRPDEGIPILREAAGRTRHPSAVLAIYQLFADSALHDTLTLDRADLLTEAESLLLATRMPNTLKAIALGQLAGAHQRLGKSEEALRTAELALEKDNLNPAALFLTGWLRVAMGDAGKAKSHFTALLNVSQKDQKPLGIYGLAVCYFYAGDFANATEQFRRAVSQGGPLLEPFAYSRAAMSMALAGEDPGPDLKKAVARVAELEKRGVLTQNSGIHWLVAMAHAYAAKNVKHAAEAARKAPLWDRDEAQALVSALESGAVSAGWLGVKA